MLRSFTRDEFECAQESEVWHAEEGGKHSCTFHHSVCTFEGKLYMFSYDVDYNEGLMAFQYSDSISGLEVEPYER